MNTKNIDKVLNIQKITNEKLCIGCGACSSVCPNDAISLLWDSKFGTYKPVINNEKCKNCGRCLLVCPCNDQIEINNNIIGKFRNVYIGYATDPKIRFSSSSGGIVTSILLSCLREKIIDGAILTRACNENPVRVDSFLATNRDEILSAKGSKYNISPVCKWISYIKRNKGRFAVVGLPCHIKAYRKASEFIPELKERIVLYIGLFCNHVSYGMATKFLLEKEGIHINEVESISYRGRGWPGGMMIKLKNGTEYRLPSSEYWPTYFSSYFFTPVKCLLCEDATAKYADISVGDAWLPKLRKDKLGSSIIITRTEMGEKIIERFKEKDIILEKDGPEDVILSNAKTIFFKRRVYHRSKLVNLFFKTCVDESKLKISSRNKITIKELMGDFLVTLNVFLSRKTFFYRFLLKIPKKVIRKYNGLVDRLR